MVLLPLPWFCYVLFGYPYGPAEENKIGFEIGEAYAHAKRLDNFWCIGWTGFPCKRNKSTLGRPPLIKVSVK